MAGILHPTSLTCQEWGELGWRSPSLIKTSWSSRGLHPDAVLAPLHVWLRRVSFLTPFAPPPLSGSRMPGRSSSGESQTQTWATCALQVRFISGVESGCRGKNRTIILCGPQKKEEKLAVFWDSCPALLWLWVVKLQHATRELVWQRVCWDSPAEPLAHACVFCQHCYY